LINQFIHQEYGDPTAPAQIVIRPGETVLFNVGHSLVDSEQLSKGGRSQSRNPLIARALRLIGFADQNQRKIICFSIVLKAGWASAGTFPGIFQNANAGPSQAARLATTSRSCWGSGGMPKSLPR
jgi:hypothetical protein